MTRPFVTAAIALSLMIGLGTSVASAAPCRDAKGKFIKCPPKGPAKAQRCRGPNGKFAKCGTPGAKPV